VQLGPLQRSSCRTCPRFMRLARKHRRRSLHSATLGIRPPPDLLARKISFDSQLPNLGVAICPSPSRCALCPTHDAVPISRSLPPVSGLIAAAADPRTERDLRSWSALRYCFASNLKLRNAELGSDLTQDEWDGFQWRQDRAQYSPGPTNDCAPKQPPECDCGRKSSEGSP
jgi:hypothetical protein